MPLSWPSAGESGKKLGGGGDRLRLVLRRHLFSSDINFFSASASLAFSSMITFSSASTEVGDARFLWREQRGGHATVPWHYGSWPDSWSLRLLGSRSLVRNSWGSHAHPLVSCFVSLVLFVSLFVISLVVISLVVSCLPRA